MHIPEGFPEDHELPRGYDIYPAEDVTFLRQRFPEISQLDMLGEPFPKLYGVGQIRTYQFNYLPLEIVNIRVDNEVGVFIDPNSGHKQNAKFVHLKPHEVERNGDGNFMQGILSVMRQAQRLRDPSNPIEIKAFRAQVNAECPICVN